jgi:ATP-dependent Clp protease ATP-binding subunit ClpA
VTEDLLQRFLDYSAQDLSALAAEGRLRPCHGREDEVAAVLHCLALPRAGRALLVGPPRVGKTAIIHEVVRRITSGSCPEPLRGRRVVELMPYQLLAGLGADWASQLQGFLRDLGRREELLVYFGDLASTLGAGVHGQSPPEDLATLLMEYVPSESLRCVAEVRLHGLRQLQAAVPAVSTVFEAITVAEPQPTVTLDIVNRVADELEVEQNIQIDASARDAAIELTRMFNVSQAFPGKAIALLEATANAAPGRDAGTLPLIDQAAVAAHFSARTGLTRALTDEHYVLDEAQVRRAFSERVIGQDQVLEAVIQVISLVRARLNDPNRALGVLLFLGPTGVGKTELAKALTAWLFGDESRLVRFNMADFQSDWDYQKLFGDPHDDDLPDRRGQLTLRLADEPFAVLLLDEFEKANSRIFHRFLQLFDEGVLINGDSETVNMRNTIIIATSNFGAQAYGGLRTLGFASDPTTEQIEDWLTEELERFFTPEFINRLDSVCFFRPLSKAVLLQIARREINELFGRAGIARRGLVLEMDEEVVEHVVERGYSPRHGARHLKRQIERAIGYPLAHACTVGPRRSTGRPTPWSA